MNSVAGALQDHDTLPAALEDAAARRDVILAELDRILTSRFFRSAGRSKQFLDYVVRHSLDGHPEQLKERTIGTEVFHRPAGYATGDDPVVRVQAGEVRRRLEQYYQATPGESQVRIELPVGSYSPHFQFGAVAAVLESPAPSLPKPQIETSGPKPRTRYWIFAIAAVLLIAGAMIAAINNRQQARKTALLQFWNPVLASQQPVLICLAKPVAYRPVEEIYRRYSKTHPGTFQTEAERSNNPLPLDPDEKLRWGDLFVYDDYGVAGGDVYAAVALSGLMGKLDKPAQLRVGHNYNYADLRNSPAIVVGGFNNKWTMQLTASLHYALIEDHEKYMIREQVPGGHTWMTGLNDDGDTTEDYGIVSRLIDSKTGQFTVTVAGIGPMGTQAAGELISNGKYLEEALRQAPASWQGENLELVLHTTVTDGVPGPAQVVASYFW